MLMNDIPELIWEDSDGWIKQWKNRADFAWRNYEKGRIRNDSSRHLYQIYASVWEIPCIDALNDEKIADFKKYHEETRSLIKYYYMDIPQDVCTGIREFENKYSSNLLGSEWHEYLFGSYEEFKEKIRDKDNSLID